MRKALNNILSLAAVQGANALLPLVIFPITLARVGAEPYGLLVQAEALSLFLLTFVLYSFEVTGVAAVVTIADERNAAGLSSLLSRILTVRLVLFCIGMPLLCLAAVIINPELLPLTVAWCLVPLSFALSPNWLFQGLRDNGFLAVSNVLSRGLAMGLVVAVVQEPSQVILVPVIVGGCYLSGAVASLAAGLAKHNLRLVSPQLAGLRELIAGGRHVFLGNLSAILYKDINTLLLGVLGASSGAIAAYSLAEKLVKALQAAVRPLNQHFFPHAIDLAASSRSRRSVLTGIVRLSAIQQVALVIAIAGAAVAYFVFGAQMLAAIGAKGFVVAAGLFFLMSLAPVLGVGNFMLGTAGLNAMGETRFVLGALIITGFTTLLCGTLLISLWSETGAALSFVLGEAILLVLLLVGYLKPPTQRRATQGYPPA